MSFVDFLFAFLFTISLTLLMSCVWKRFKAKNVQKSEPKVNDTNGDHIIDNSGGVEARNEQGNDIGGNGDNSDPQSRLNAEQSRPLIQIRGSDHLFDESLVSNSPQLEHINKSRPRRSQVRRSTRKSKYERNSNIFSMDNENGTNDIIDRPRNGELEADLSQRLSMFSMRIEEVTQPLTPTQKSNSIEFNIDNK